MYSSGSAATAEAEEDMGTCFTMAVHRQCGNQFPQPGMIPRQRVLGLGVRLFSGKLLGAVGFGLKVPGSSEFPDPSDV